MTTIYDFAAQLNASARANQFRVHINFPAGLVSNGVVAKTAATFLTSQASLPSYTTEDIPVWYRGRQIHEAGEKQYEQWTCTIYNSSDFAIRTALEEWVSAIHDPEVVAGITDPSKYKTNIVIEQLDRNNNTLRVYKLYGAYPVQTGTIELAFEQGQQIEQFQPAFVFDYFKVGGKDLLEESTN